MSMSQENFLKYQRTDAKCKRLLSKKKRNGWTRFCESLDPRSPISIVWDKIKKFRRSVSANDPPSNDASIWLDSFADKLAPPSVPHENCLPSISLLPSSDPMDAPFSISELQCVLSDLKDSSPGEDGIPYSFLTNLNPKAKLAYLKMINKLFELGVVPSSWKSQIIIPFLKAGKDPLDPSSYRPIALSSTLAKTMEHLIKNRLEWAMESRGLLAKSQFGFRKGLGTMDSLGIFTTDIRTALARGEFLVGVFLDIAAAYDNVLLPVLRHKLQQLRVSPRITRFICNLLLPRSIVVKTNSLTLPPRTIWKGLPQGSVLSPILYSIYTYDLELSVNSFCNILQYADDIALYSNSNSMDEICYRLNSALQYLGQWLSDHGLSLSIDKCKAVIFTRRRQIPLPNIIFENQQIPLARSAKFLGIILDSRLNGVAHVEYILQKCEKSINVLRALSGVWWGAHP